MSSPHSLMGSESPPSPDPDISPNAGKKGFGNFWSELRRRKVVRVAITYAIVAWLIMQVAGLTFEGFGVPIWAFRFVVIMVWLFFPVALIITWAFELTPDGIKTTKTARQERGGAPAPEDQQRKRNWFTVFFAAAIPTLIFGSLAIFFYIKAPRPETPEMVLAAPDTQESDMSIAVLPLGNLSPDPDNAFFAAGVHEDILTNLSKIKALRVISRTSTAGYKDTTKNLMEIGKELGVRYLVEGSVRRADNRVRVTVQLINARTDQHIWAENYDRTLEDIFAIQSAIATEIAEKLQAVISPEEVEQLEKLPTSNLEAYDFFLRFRQLQRDSDSVGPAGDEKIALLEKAVELDPEYAEAWAQLSIECVWWWAV
ncbi:MAG TPA: hypothetical protein VK995_02705, partial [Oceanipulchritudo sp.]|nr:hypothetical protein [Oceanipulchritudo sp.]